MLRDIFTPNFLLIIGIICFNQIGAGGYASAMNLWGGKVLALSATQLGTAATSAFVAMIIIRLVAGKYVDTFGIKFQVVFGSVITAGAVMLMGMANTFLLYVVMRAAYFATRSILGTTTMTIGNFCTDRKYVGTNTALQNFLPSLLSVAGVLGVQRILDKTAQTAPSTVWFVLGGVYLLGMLPGLFINLKDARIQERQKAMERKLAKRGSQRKGRAGKKIDIKEWLYFPIIPIASINFFCDFVSFSIEIIIVVLGLERGVDMVVYWLAGVGIFKAVGSVIGGVLADICNKAKFTVPPCLLLSIGSCLVLILTDDPLLVTAAGAMYALSSRSLGPVLRKITVIVTPDEYRGTMTSTSSMMTDLAGVTGSMLAGILCDTLGAVSTLWITACLPVLGIVVFVATYKKIAAAEEMLLQEQDMPAAGGAPAAENGLGR